MSESTKPNDDQATEHPAAELTRLREFEISIYAALAEAGISKAGAQGIRMLAQQRDGAIAEQAKEGQAIYFGGYTLRVWPGPGGEVRFDPAGRTKITEAIRAGAESKQGER